MKTFVLRDDRAAQSLWAFLKANWKAMAEAGKPLQVECFPEKSSRSLEQNRRYWAMLRVIEETGWIHGRQFTSEIWHEFFRRTFIGCLDLPNGGTVGMSTTKLSVDEFSTYMTQVEAYASQNLGVQFLEVA